LAELNRHKNHQDGFVGHGKNQLLGKRKGMCGLLWLKGLVLTKRDDEEEANNLLVFNNK
jgi:hypothetical protein